MDCFVVKTSSCKTISSATPTCSSAGDILIESDTVSNSTSTTSELVTTCSSQNPWPYIQDFFEFVSCSEDGDRMVFKCLNCLPVFKCYKAQKKSLYSLRSHIASIHGKILTRFNKCVKEGWKEHVRKKRDLSGEYGLTGSSSAASFSTSAPSGLPSGSDEIRGKKRSIDCPKDVANSTKKKRSSEEPPAVHKQSYQLSHNNHLSLVLNQLAEDEAFMDVTLTAEGRPIKAHKSVLSAVSPYFSSVLRANPCQHPIIIMPAEVHYKELANILAYIYRGQLTIPYLDIERLLKTAELLQVVGLCNAAGTPADQPIPLPPTTDSAMPQKKLTEPLTTSELSANFNPTEFMAQDMVCYLDKSVPDVRKSIVGAPEDWDITIKNESEGNLSEHSFPIKIEALEDSNLSASAGIVTTEALTDVVDPVPGVCPYCQKLFGFEVMNLHLTNEHPLHPAMSCSICNRVYTTRDASDMHRKHCHGNMMNEAAST